MRRKQIEAGIAVAVLAGAVQAWASVTTAERSDAHGQPIITMENEFLKVEVMPGRGGRVRSFLDKRSGTQHLYWDSESKHGLGGLLDDHEPWTERPFAYKLEKDGSEARLTLSCEDDRLAITKTCILAAGAPFLTVEYSIGNRTQEVIGRLQTRNFIVPGGGAMTRDDVYFIPVSSIGVTESPYRVALPAELWQGYIMPKLGAPWHALVDVKKKSGIAFFFRTDFQLGVYYWMDSDVFPTYEWFAKPLQPGRLHHYTVDVIAVDGFTGLVDARTEYLLDAGPTVKGDRLLVPWHFSPLVGEARSATVAAIVREAETGKELGRSEKAVEADGAGGVTEGYFDFALASKKNLLVLMQVSIEGKTFREARIPVTQEAESSPFESRLAYDEPFSMTALPGWEKLDATLLPRPAAEEEERGFLLYETVRDRVPVSAYRIAVDVGVDEFESLPVHVYPLRDIGRVSVSPARPGKAKIEVRVQEDTFFPDAMQHNVWMKLLEASDFAAEKDTPRAVWLTVDSRGLQPGTYTERLTVSASAGGRCALALEIRVWPVRRPRKRFFSAEGEHLLNFLCEAEGKPGWDLDKGRAYARDLVEHNTNSLILCACWNTRRPDFREVRIRATGEPLVDAIRAEPERFKTGALPKLDLSYWYPVLFTAIEAGMTRCNRVVGYVPAYFGGYHAVTRAIHGDVAVRSPEQDRVRAWMHGEISRFIEEAGFRRRYAKLDDETPADKFPMFIEAARELRAAGFRVGMTTSNHLVSSRKWSRVINPHLDWWQIGTVDPRNIRLRLADGGIDPPDELWSYMGSGRVSVPYDGMRNYCGMRLPYSGLTGFHIHEYWRWSQGAAMIYPTPAGPIGSPAWEGARDGFDDAEYYGYARALISALPAHRRPAFEKRLDAIIGEGEDAVLRMGYEVTGSAGEALELKNPGTEAFRRAKVMLLELIVDLEGKARLPASFAFGDLDITGWTFVAGEGVDPDEVKALEGYIRDTFGLDVRVVSEGSLSVRRRPGPIVLLGGPSECAWTKELDASLADPLFSGRYPPPGWYVIRELAPEETGGERILVVAGRDRQGTARALAAFRNFLE